MTVTQDARNAFEAQDAFDCELEKFFNLSGYIASSGSTDGNPNADHFQDLIFEDGLCPVQTSEGVDDFNHAVGPIMQNASLSRGPASTASSNLELLRQGDSYPRLDEEFAEAFSPAKSCLNVQDWIFSEDNTVSPSDGTAPSTFGSFRHGGPPFGSDQFGLLSSLHACRPSTTMGQGFDGSQADFQRSLASQRLQAPCFDSEGGHCAPQSHCASRLSHSLASFGVQGDAHGTVEHRQHLKRKSSAPLITSNHSNSGPLKRSHLKGIPGHMCFSFALQGLASPSTRSTTEARRKRQPQITRLRKLGACFRCRLLKLQVSSFATPTTTELIQGVFGRKPMSSVRRPRRRCDCFVVDRSVHVPGVHARSTGKCDALWKM